MGLLDVSATGLYFHTVLSCRGPGRVAVLVEVLGNISRFSHSAPLLCPPKPDLFFLESGSFLFMPTIDDYFTSAAISH